MKLRETLGKMLDQFQTSRKVYIVMAILCLSISPVQAQNERRADLSNLVVIGDSLAAGFQNGSLLDVQQTNGFASLIAAQAQVSVTPAAHRLPRHSKRHYQCYSRPSPGHPNGAGCFYGQNQSAGPA